MEENVALDSKKQRKFNKSIKGIKKLLKKNDNKPGRDILSAKAAEVKKKKIRKQKGLVYLSHIPHGFYENEMTQYFKQFGMVTSVRVIRSARTGRSRGCAFVAFREPAVADIVAETMNNYLMGKRLIKACIVPPEKQRRNALRKRWTQENNPTATRKQLANKAFNTNKNEAGNLKKARKLLSNLSRTKKKLAEIGINYDFFTPVDIPETLLNNSQKQEKLEDVKVKLEMDSKQKKIKKEKSVVEEEKTILKEKNKKTQRNKSTEVKSKNEKQSTPVVNQKEQQQKQKTIKDAGVTLPENFIKIKADSDEESDSDLEFDSDEYEKMMEDEGDSDLSSGDDDSESGDDGGEELESDDDADETIESNADEASGGELLPPLIPVNMKKGKNQVVAMLSQPKKQKQGQNPQQSKAQMPPQGQGKKSLQQQGQKPQEIQGRKTPNNQGQKPQKKQGQRPRQTRGQVLQKNQGQKSQQDQIKKSQQNEGQKSQQKSPQQLKRKNSQPEISPKKPKFEKKNDQKQRNKQFKKKTKFN